MNRALLAPTALSSNPRMRSSLLVSCLFATPLLIACGSPSPGGTQPVGNVVLHDANNYTSTRTLTIPVIQTTPGADLQVCWNGLTKDLLCHDIIGGTERIDNVSFLQIPNIVEDGRRAEAGDGKDVNLVKIYGQIKTSQTTGTCTMLSALANASTASPLIVPATD